MTIALGMARTVGAATRPVQESIAAIDSVPAMMAGTARLAAFVAVADELHFGRAAARLQISQPSLSNRLRRLEAELGVQLVDRTSRRVALTAAGEELLPDAREVVRATERLTAGAQALRTGAAAAVRIGFTGSAASRLLPLALRGARARWPDLVVTVRDLADRRYDLLRDGTVDLVLGRLEPHEAPDLDVVVAAREHRVAALWDGHPLAVRPVLAMRDFAEDGFITQPEHVNPGFREEWLAEQDRHGLPGRIAGEATTVQEFLQLTATGRGICIVPETAAHVHPWPGITYRPVEDARPAVTSVILRRGERRRRLLALRDAAVTAASGDRDDGASGDR